MQVSDKSAHMLVLAFAFDKALLAGNASSSLCFDACTCIPAPSTTALDEPNTGPWDPLGLPPPPGCCTAPGEFPN